MFALSSHSCLNSQARLVHSLIEAYGLLKGMRLVSPLPATVEQLQEFHDPQYIQMLQRASEADEEEDFYEAPSKVSHNGTTHIVCYFLRLTTGNNSFIDSSSDEESDDHETFGLQYDCSPFQG